MAAVEQLALASQIEALQQQQQQIAATHQQYVNLGMIQPQQHLPGSNVFSPIQGQMTNMSPHANTFQFPQQLQQHLGVSMNAPTQPSTHRRNQSALPNMGMGPPPAPSSGASGFGEYSTQGRENVNPRGRGGGAVGGGHTRRHSLALDEAKKAAEVAEQKRKTSGFQFPLPGAAGSTTASSNRSESPANAGAAQSSDTGANTRTATRGGHGRSQSMAVGNIRGGQSRGMGSFQFPPPQATTDAGATNNNAAAANNNNNNNNNSGQSDFVRRGSQGHGRTSSRNFDGNWRQPNNNPQALQEQQATNMGNFNMNANAGAAPFQPGHRQRGSMNQSVGSIGNFQYPAQPQLVQTAQGPVLVQPQMFGAQTLNPLQIAHLQALQAAQLNGQGMAGLQASQHAPGGMQMQQQQQQRKTLFTPYLPQATLPALLSDGQLVAGILRVNKKNRSDAYVTTTDLDADIFICGSKDRNRALEGDLVAVELLDVDEVWGQKREKEEKKKRKDNTDARGSSIAVNDATTQPETSQSGTEGGIRRRGSLRQRPTQKKNDDVEVEGQSLLLMEEEEINDEQKPLYAGHIVAVIERVAGQMFSGTLGLLRPSSQATKEKQEAERQAREGNSGRPQQDRQQDKPKIVWFKPTDKRVPLIAIPTEQAPRDFVERHQDYANRIFVACIKRWPITSLHPFGTLVEQLGEMGDLRVETDALLRDNNFGPDDFSDAVIKNIGFEDWSVANDGEAALEGRRDFRDEKTFTIDPNGSKELDDAIHFKTLDDGMIEIGIHVADVAHFIKAGSLVDREAKKRGTAVYLMNRTVNMLPPRLSTEICCLNPDEERYTISIVFKVDAASGYVNLDDTWIGKGLIKSSGKLSYDEVDCVINGRDSGLGETREKDIRMLHQITQKFRQARFGGRSADIPPLRLLYQLDDENVPVEQNIFDSSPAHELIEELSHLANAFVARTIHAGIPDKALLRRQASPNPRRLQTFAERMTNIGYEIDITSSGSLQNSLFDVEDAEFRKGMETLLVKAMQRAKYFVAGKIPEDSFSHYALNLPLYTHFTNPSRRYADIVVHRQLEAVLSNGAIEFTEDIEALAKTAEMCNTKKDSAHSAQEQSVHIEACRKMDKKREELGGDLISVGIVLCVYESAFDVLIPEFGFEKRVHCDQLPLKKAEFDKNKRLLELYWEKGVPSSTYVPEDERPKAGSGRANAASAAREAEAAKQRAKESEDARRRQMETGTMSTDDVDALFDDDDDDASEITEMTAGVSLAGADRPTQSMPPSPTRNGPSSGQAPHRTKSDSKLGQSASDVSETKLSNKEKYFSLFSLREENGDYIQDVREMTRIPVILKTDLTKSPPCLTIRSLNPYAL
ncbi:Translational repressor [Coniosporium tulheliwenetii]|uniref:Translational repressor n=1 Tax=Coniosporium tulheliwenetii TaxID=3383036 RepID=A0ACC2ZKA6_9PEZI|nr:Translational repressor [Cladosporium sp. JES 115]